MAKTVEEVEVYLEEVFDKVEDTRKHAHELEESILKLYDEMGGFLEEEEVEA